MADKSKTPQPATAAVDPLVQRLARAGFPTARCEQLASALDEKELREKAQAADHKGLLDLLADELGVGKPGKPDPRGNVHYLPKPRKDTRKQ